MGKNKKDYGKTKKLKLLLIVCYFNVWEGGVLSGYHTYLKCDSRTYQLNFTIGDFRGYENTWMTLEMKYNRDQNTVIWLCTVHYSGGTFKLRTFEWDKCSEIGRHFFMKITLYLYN